MTPEMEKLIASFPDMTEEQAKLVFIRKSAQEAYEKGEIKEATAGILKEIVLLGTVASMTREEVGTHIANLEKVRTFLAAFTQGLMKAHADKLEPEFKEKRRKQKLEEISNKVAARSSDSKVNALIQMAVNAAKEGKILTKGKVEEESTLPKVKCEKCQKDVYSLKFHKCK